MRHVTRALGSVALIGAALAGGLTQRAVAAQSAQATLTYEAETLTLTNSGAAPLDLTLLVFVRDDPDGPVRFEAGAWGLSSPLAPGVCVQLRTPDGAARLPSICRGLARWFQTGRRELKFWQISGDVDQFRVIAGSEELTQCPIRAGHCVFTPPAMPRFEPLYITYTADELVIGNATSTAAPIGRLMFCKAARDGQCGEQIPWRTADVPASLVPGTALELTIGENESVPPGGTLEALLPVVGAIRLERAFWQQPFVVISPVSARIILCPPAIPDRWRQCIVAR